MRIASGCYLTLAGLSTVAALSADPCTELQKHSSITKLYGIKDPISDVEIPVSVWGGGRIPRAAAALLVVLLKYILGYSAHLTQDTPILCNFTVGDDWRRRFVVAPAILPTTDCPYGENHSYNLTAFNRTTIAYSLQLLAYVSDQKCLGSFSNFFYVNATTLKSCDFRKPNKDTCTSHRFFEPCFAVLARNESFHDNVVINELQRGIKKLQLPLQIEYYQNDLQLHKTILQMQKENKSFLFLDEDIWGHVPGIYRVQAPNCVKSNNLCETDLKLEPNAVIFGVGDAMQEYAFPIWQIVTRFSPSSEDLRQIFEHEIYPKNDANIEQAACSWSLKHKNVIQNWTSHEEPTYDIVVYLCKYNTDLEEHQFISNLTFLNLKNSFINILQGKIDCYDSENMLTTLNYIASRNPLTCCVIAWGWSITSAVVNAAKHWKLPLLLTGPTMPDLPLTYTNAKPAATAPLTYLIHAYLELFKRCEWSRIAILSDDLAYSKNFIKVLLGENKLLTRERIINLENIDSSLEKFREEDARIFLVNTNSNTSHAVLCSALKKRMTPAAGIIWIVRDWRAVNCSEGDKTNTMYHFTLGLSWRGGPTAGGSTMLQNKFRKMWKLSGNELAGSLDSTSLVDAILLSYEVFSHLHEYPSYKYGLYRQRNSKHFLKIKKKLSINGTAQELKGKSNKTLIFIEKWSWTKGESIALWYATPKGVLEVWPNKTEASSCEKLLGSQVFDRKRCLTFTTGDEFAPRCHLTTVIIVIIILTIAVIALTVARHARLSKLRRRQNQENQRVASWLERYLVKRNLITLYYEIGSGSNGRVSFAKLRQPSGTVIVAAKELRKNIASFEMNEILHEACILAPLNHENIIRLVGVCLEDGPAIVLMEHAFYSDLQKYLTVRRRFAVSVRNDQVSTEEAMEVSDSELTRFTREAARGLEYLADKRLVHRDVRAANCLVDINRSLKLADFGMARELDSEASLYMTTRRGLFPILWMPPESLTEGIFSTASDIWALGVLILEVATLGARPYYNWPLERVLHYVKSGGHPPLPPDISKNTRSIVLQCWQVDVKSRPTAAFINKYLTRNPHSISRALLSPDIPEALIPFSSLILKDEIENIH